jgi:serine/threonine-protein kinase PpkA
LQWLEAIGTCLEFVHRKGIIHRDIKPGNILFHKDGTPILTDFGTAKQQESDAKLTMEGRAVGSPYYISPEQAASKELDSRSDIYSLGIVLYEMLTGNRPYQGDSYIETIVAHMTEPVPVLPPKLRRYQTLINKMIAKSPDDRFTSAAEMVHFVQQLRRPVTKTWPVTWIPAGAAAITAGMMRLVQPLLKPVTKKGRMTWKVTAALGAVLGIGGIVLVGQSLIPDPDEHRVASNMEVAERTVTENAPDPTEMPVPEPGSQARETSATADRDEHRAEPVLTMSDGEAPEAPEVPKAPEVTAALKAPEAPPTVVEMPSPEPSVPARETPVQASDNEQRIEKLLSKAAAALDAYRLTKPKTSNAHMYYQRILALDPQNEEAVQGINRVVEAYADLAERKLVQYDYEAAKSYLERGLSIQPTNHRLQALRREANIGELLWQADTALKEYRLTSPKNNNAFYYYQRVLELHPKHKQALNGITRVANAYADLAESKLDQFKYADAKKYLQRGLTVQPDNARLQELQKKANSFRDVPKRIWNKIKSPFS